MFPALRTIRWRLTISSLLAISIPLLVLSFFAASRLWSFYLQQLEQELSTKARVIADMTAPILSPTTPDDPLGLELMVERWRRFSNMRVIIIDKAGVIRASTVRSDVGTYVNQSSRPGLLDALEGHENTTVWKSPNFDYEDTMYVNLPIQEDGQVIGAVRVAYSLKQIQQNVGLIRFTLFGAVAVYGVLIVVLTVWLAGSITHPVEELDRGAQRLAAGDLGHRIEVGGTDEITHLANTLNRMSERLQELEGLRRQYVSNVSHELRTPLAAIRGMAETLLEHGKSDPELGGRYLPRIVVQTERLARLATQLLDLAQIESGNLVSRFAPVSLSTVVEEVLHTCVDTASLKGVHLQSQIAAGLPPLSGEHDRLVQVCLNLLDNAIRHTPPGGTVEIQARIVGEQVEVRVSDTGPGIPAEHLPHLFERFYRVDQARSRGGGGTGLGLSIVRQIVELHGGHIWVESKEDVGTSFTFSIPLNRAADHLVQNIDMVATASSANLDQPLTETRSGLR